MSQTAYRTHHATEVTEALVGQKVTLAGWVDRRRDTAVWRSSICVTTPVSCRSSSMMRNRAARCAANSSSGHRRVRLRPDGNETRIWPLARSRSSSRISRCSPRPTPCRSSVHRARERVREQASGRGRAPEVPLSRFAPPADATQPEAAFRYDEAARRARRHGLH